MDWIFLSCLIGITLLRLVISYDIACQWRKNLWERMTEYPEEMRLPSDLEVKVGIPNWHVNGHGLDCQNNLSLSYIPGVGRTCGEDVKTSWAHTNSLAPSTREMGPGARRETLNDHWNGWNFRKIVGFRESIFFSWRFCYTRLMIFQELYFSSASRMQLQCVKSTPRLSSNFPALSNKIHVQDGQGWSKSG